MRTINLHTGYNGGKYKRSLSCQDERENGLNEAYPYGKQAQVMNEIGKNM